jgi:DNA-binding SARP family transcriptional activator
LAARLGLDIGPELADKRDGSSPRAHLALLKGFELKCDGEPVHLPLSAQRLLAFLALQQRPVNRVYVAGVLWLDASEERANANLRSTLWRLRRPGHELVEATLTHLSLADGVSVDLRLAESHARLLLDQTADWSADPYEVSLSGDLLPDWYDDWVLVERERFRQLRLHALESLCERMTAAGKFAQAVDAGLSAVSAEPLRESAHRTLVRAYLAEGNVAEALRQYRFCSKVLADDLGIQPSAEMEALIKGLRQRDEL